MLMGEHAAVYGRPALIAAVDRRLTVEMATTSGTGVRLELPQVGVASAMPWAEIFDYIEQARADWCAYEREPSPESFRRLRGDDPAHLVKIALGEAALAAGDAPENRPPGLELHLDSEIPIGAGFGSSAATAVAVVRAYLALRDREMSAGELHRLTLEIERRQHGQPSGVDNATVIHGGLVWAERDADGTLRASPLEVHSTLLGEVRIYNSGEPRESTGAVVAAVRRFRDTDTERCNVLLDRMEAATRELRELLTSEGRPAATLVCLMREFESCLEGLGVVPPAIREVVRTVEARGGSAKISGAGALTGDGAGSILVYHPDPREVDRWDVLTGLTRLDVRLGTEGVRVEAT